MSIETSFNHLQSYTSTPTHLKSCIYNAAGANCTTWDNLYTLYTSDAGAVVSKSTTFRKRFGNPHPRYYENEFLSINSTGLANNGHQFYNRSATELPSLYPNHQKPFFMSVSGLSMNENLDILLVIESNDNITAVELNLSCPNIAGKGQTGYDFEASNELLREVFEFYEKPIGLKLPPYFDRCHFSQMADVIKQYPKIAFVTCINSLGNGLVIHPDLDEQVIVPNKGLGGIGGSVVKPFALSNVYQFYQLLSPKVDIIGCGGVTTGRDVYEHILVGAQAVQIGTQLMREGVGCFTRIGNELREIMEKKGYESLDDFRGKLAH